MNLFRRRSVADLQAEVLTDKRLKRALGPVNLTALGIGAVIGAGIFVLTGQAAAKYAGPAIVFSFVLAGLADCVLVMARPYVSRKRALLQTIHRFREGGGREKRRWSHHSLGRYCERFFHGGPRSIKPSVS